ncbi:MAG: hypothetical protein Q9M48_06045 [Rhodobacterales bacterium]|nr:hypothetical protein [Rhodobacterales bacterium]
MFLPRPLITASTLFALSASTAHAEIPPQDVWNNWRAYAAAYGIELRADIARSDGKMHLTNMRYIYDLSPDTGRLEIFTGATTLTANTDGTVALILPESANVKMSFTPESGPATTADFTATLEKHTLTARGAPTTITYDFAADSFGFAFDRMRGKFSDKPFSLNLVFDALSGSSTHTKGESFKIISGLSVGNTAFFLEANTPDENYSMVGTIANIDLETATTLPNDGLDPLDLPAQLRAGLAFDTTITTGQSTQTTTTTMDTKTSGLSPSGNLLGTQTLKMNESNLTVAMSQTGLSADTTTLGYAIEISQSGLPFPIHAFIATTKSAFSLPLLTDPEPQGFALTLALESLRINDEAWAALDPETIFSRTPATLSFDLSGKARLLFEFLDFPHFDQLDTRETPPVELTALTLNSLSLFAAMAELTGTADFTFDNSDLTTFDGIPAPQGVADLRLSGANALLDALVKIGLIEDNDAIGARMALGIFMMAGDAPDTLTSSIEINDKGHISANGQRLK